MSNALQFGSKVVFLNGSPLTLPSAATDPVSAVNGDMYYNTSVNKVKVYSGGAWTILSAASGISYSVNIYTLNSTDISNKFVLLSDIPTTPSDTILNIIGGIVQDYGNDYEVSMNILSWDGLGLESILSVGDKIIVQFS